MKTLHHSDTGTKASSQYAFSISITNETTVDTYNVCKVSADLSDVPDHKFMRARSGIKGEEFFIAEFKLEATFLGGNVDWKFIFDGKEYGSVSTSYDN